MSIYDFFEPHSKIWNVSDPRIVRDNYHKLYKNHIEDIFNKTNVISEIYPSSRKNKKYMVFDGVSMVHFGDLRYEDYTKHKDPIRRENYRKRFNNPDSNVYSPYNLSLNLLW